jgi:hypothetical protein
VRYIPHASHSYAVLAPGSATGVPRLTLPKTQILIFSPEKMSLVLAFRQGFWAPIGLNQVAKKCLNSGALVGFRRDAFLSYFGKQSVKWAYFPQEPK